MGTYNTLLNKKEKYNRFLLPNMIMEGPESIRIQEQEYSKQLKKALS